MTASYTRTGNIGGILARTTSTGSVFYGYDGGGNVTTLTNASDAVVGSYTYDAYGNSVYTSGVAAFDNPYRFSTKEQIGGLYSYGFRFYSPGLGRWINRDPISERGGGNLYCFVGNNPVNQVDIYGLQLFALSVDVDLTSGGVTPEVPAPAAPVPAIPAAPPTPSEGGFSIPRPQIEDAGGRLDRLVENLYHGAGKPGQIGNGSTGDAVANEAETGEQTGGRWHFDKASESMNGLRRVLRNPRTTPGDRSTAEDLLKGLENSLAKPRHPNVPDGFPTSIWGFYTPPQRRADFWDRLDPWSFGCR